MKSGVTLQQMLTEVKRQSESKEDYLIAPNRLRMESYGKEMFLHLSDDSGTELIEPMTITGIAHRQIGTHLRIPAAYYDRMREERPDLLAYNANTWFKQESSQRMLRTLDGSARAYLSNRYRRIDNIDIAGVTLPILGGLPDIRFESCQITESRMYIKAVNPRLQAEVSPGDIVQAGVIISNSEVGLGSVSIQPLIYRLVCSNGINYPLYKGRRTSMWDLIPRKLMPPTRVARYCCAVLKEQNGKGRFLATGVRWAESVSRSKRRGIFEKQVSNHDKEVHIRNDEESLDALFAPCKLAAKRFVNPIMDWNDREVWDFLHDARIPVNPLYFCGFSRVGCIGCPMAGKHRYFEFARYPQYEKLYLMAFDRMLKERRRRERIDGSWGKGATAEEVFHWWMEDDFIPGQMSLEEFLYVC